MHPVTPVQTRINVPNEYPVEARWRAEVRFAEACMSQGLSRFEDAGARKGTPQSPDSRIGCRDDTRNLGICSTAVARKSHRRSLFRTDHRSGSLGPGPTGQPAPSPTSLNTDPVTEEGPPNRREPWGE